MKTNSMNWYGALYRDISGYDILVSKNRITKRIAKTYGDYIMMFGPYSTQQEIAKIIERTKLKVRAIRQHPRPNPPQIDTTNAIEIYDQIYAIEARKGKHSLWPNADFRHKFTKNGTKIYGLQNGNLLIVGKHPLWKTFKYPKDVSSYG